MAKAEALREPKSALELLRDTDPVLYKSLTQYERAVSDPTHYAGVILLGGEEVAQTLCCCHCNGHFLNVRLPGKARGFCMNCNAPVCPNPACDECTPYMRKLENLERGRATHFKPAWGSVTVDTIKGLE